MQRGESLGDSPLAFNYFGGLSVNQVGLIFLAAAIIAVAILPRRLAALPLLASCCYMTMGQVIEIGGLHFFLFRFVIIAGCIRVFLRGEHIVGPLSVLDKSVIVWSCLSLVMGMINGRFQSMLGIVFTFSGSYFVFRSALTDIEAVKKMSLAAGLLFIGVALCMLYEKLFDKNLFVSLGALPDVPKERGDKIRAQGPFRHPILAGTAGAIFFPLLIGAYKQHRKTALIGLVACATMVVTCASSGPIATVLLASFGMLMWKRRQHVMSVTKFILWSLFALEVVKAWILGRRHVWYLMASVDFTGGSTGDHRAELITAGLQHISEWWLMGTNYTRHWLPTGVSWSPDNVDITNHYLFLGVAAGLPSMLAFIYTIRAAFVCNNGTLRLLFEAPKQEQFFVWVLGCSLCAQTVTFMTIAYFDQTICFWAFTLAAIAVIHAASRKTMESTPTSEESEECFTQ